MSEPTSEEAFKKFKKSKNSETIDIGIIDFLKGCPSGAPAYDVWYFGFDRERFAINAVSPRFAELETRGLVVKDGKVPSKHSGIEGIRWRLAKGEVKEAPAEELPKKINVKILLDRLTALEARVLTLENKNLQY